MTKEQQCANNRRLAELVGFDVVLTGFKLLPYRIQTPDFMPYGGDYSHQFEEEAEAWEFIVEQTDFYAETEVGTFWREEAEAAILRRIYDAYDARAGLEIYYRASGFECEIRTVDYRVDVCFLERQETMSDAVLAAILAALDAVERDNHNE